MDFGDRQQRPVVRIVKPSSAVAAKLASGSPVLAGCAYLLVLAGMLPHWPGAPAGFATALAAAWLLAALAAPGLEALLRQTPAAAGVATAAAAALRPLAPLLGTMVAMAYWWGHCAIAGLALALALDLMGSLHPQLLSAHGLSGLAAAGIWLLCRPAARAWRRALALGSAVLLTGTAAWLLWHGAGLIVPFQSGKALPAGGFLRAGVWSAGLLLAGPVLCAQESALGLLRRGLIRRGGAGWIGAGSLLLGALTLACVLLDGPGMTAVADAAPIAHGLLLMAASMLVLCLSGEAALTALEAAVGSGWALHLRTAAVIWVCASCANEAWMLAGSGLAYLLAVSAAVLLAVRRRQAARDRDRISRIKVAASRFAVTGWLAAIVLGVQFWGVQSLLLGLALAYCGGLVHVMRALPARGLRDAAAQVSVHTRLLAGMLLVLALNGAGYLIAQQALLGTDPVLAAVLGDVFTVVALLTILFGLVLPALIVQALTHAAIAAEQLSQGAVAALRDGIDMLGRGELELAPLREPPEPLEPAFDDEIGRIVASINALQDAVGLAGRGLLQARDKLRRSRDELSHQARHDSLTGLFNRRAFEDALSRLVQDRRHSDLGHALLYLDLDQFKIVNDTCGHDAGDELLRQVSLLLQAQMRSDDILSRLGGDEFGVILSDCQMDNAIRVADAMVVAVRELSFGWQDRVFRIGVSIGVVHFIGGATTLTEVLSSADKACYFAKEQGRNRLHAYSPDDDEITTRSGEMQWVSRIHEAMEEGRMCLYAQRILPLRAGMDAQQHHELLLRMVDSQGELVPPMAFIPAAERFGVMTLLDRWVVRSAFERLGELVRSGNVEHFGTLAINLSGASITDESFLEFVLEQFRLSRVPYHLVWFEITETSALANLRGAKRFIGELRGMGCRFGLDDFGGGMSSFGYLRTLEVDFLKIDGAFVRDMARDPVDHAMVAAINRIGQLMGLRTIAEFVDGEATVAMLRELGVDMAQGNGLAAPVPFVRPSSSDAQRAGAELVH